MKTKTQVKAGDEGITVSQSTWNNLASGGNVNTAVSKSGGSSGSTKVMLQMMATLFGAF